jgi:hypothetical protein
MRKMLELTMIIACFGAYDFDNRIHGSGEVTTLNIFHHVEYSTFWALMLAIILGIFLNAIFGYKQ